MLQAMGRSEDSIARFALVAPMEERIAVFRDKMGEQEMGARHRFSAAACWAKTGNLHNAIQLFDALSRSSDTPGRLKVDALLISNRLREQQQTVFKSCPQSMQPVG